MEPCDLEIRVQRLFASEVFHELSQPLTALHCTLDLSLRRDKTTTDLRRSIQDALDNAERLRQRLLLIRALNDASDPGELSATTDLNDFLQELYEDVLPLFESAGQRFEVAAAQTRLAIRGDRTQLFRGFFYFVEYLFRHSKAGATTRFVLAPGEERQAELCITSECCLPVSCCHPSDDAPYSCEIEMLRRTCQAVGGQLEFVAQDATSKAWRATLPLAQCKS